MESSHLFLVGMIIIIATLLGLALKLNRKQEKNILDAKNAGARAMRKLTAMAVGSWTSTTCVRPIARAL